MIAAKQPSLPQVHLSPGQLLITQVPQIVVTVLGSCVAVTMFDPQTEFAAICHAMLADPKPDEEFAPEDPRRMRYVTQVVPSMIAAYRRRAINLRRIEVKIFGGANVLRNGRFSIDPHGIGNANIEAARRCLENANLAVSAENTGGLHGRKILFDTSTGVVLHKQLRASHP